MSRVRLPVPAVRIVSASFAALEVVCKVAPLPAQFDMSARPVTALVVEANIWKAGLVVPLAPTANVVDARRE